MKKTKRRPVSALIRLLPPLLLLIFAAVYLLSGRELDADAILSYSPGNPALTALIILLLFIARGFSVCFPVMLLYIASGKLFPTVPALLLGLAGSALCVSIPYWIGRFSGAGAAERLSAKHPKLAPLFEMTRSNDLFAAFFTHTIIFLPGEIPGLYLGALRIPFWKYLLGSLAGVLPLLLLATLIGAKLSEPGSPLFLISAALLLLTSAASLLVYRAIQKKGRSIHKPDKKV